MEAIGWYFELNLSGSLDEDEVEDLQYLIQVLDDKYLSLELKRLEQSRKKRNK